MNRGRKKKIIAPAGFEPASPGPKPDRIVHYPTGLHRKKSLPTGEHKDKTPAA